MTQPRGHSARKVMPAIALATSVLGMNGCAGGRARLTESARRLTEEAAKIGEIAYEEDFVEARLVYQAIPLASPERARLRHRMLSYLLEPLARLDPERLRKDAGESGNLDDFDRIYDSLRDAIELFAPTELWTRGGLRLAENDRALLKAAARLVVLLYSPRGTETAVATGLFVLGALEPENREWTERVDQLLPWIDSAAEQSTNASGPTASPSAVDVLESVASRWPAPAVVNRLTSTYLERQEKMSAVLKRPLGLGSGRNAFGDLLLKGEGMQSAALDLTSVYLRSGELRQAANILQKIANKPGDDPDLRKLVAAAAADGAKAEAFLALARRFLPRLELLGGTSNDRLDPVAATQVLERGMDRFPKDGALLVLASRVARFVPATLLSMRYLEEAQSVLERSIGAKDELANLSAEQLELAFTRLRVHIDPERIEPAAREADLLHRRFAENRKRFGEGRFKLREADIDFELARGFLDAGLIERAETLFMRARKEAEESVEITLQLANLALKRGEAGRAAQIAREALESQEPEAPNQETIPVVEGQSKLARVLGNAYEAAGKVGDARKAWQLSLHGWERLMGEQLRRKNVAAASEATSEVGRLYYLLGRRAEASQKFLEAIDQNESRDQSYIDALSFLVQRGEADAARDIYRRAISKPNRVVSEYVKIYSSLWILDLTRRSGKAPDPAAEAFLRTVTTRPVVLRPTRATAWYLPLARYAIGRLTYEQLASIADTAGKRAELYFYEAMRRLAEGRSDDAHELWNKVIQTKMFSFFEFEMAARYLRTGAPSHARPEKAADTETI